ncbi:hypothetical protein EZV62_001901 [Acer yangbiense]|uniref:Uncharacterized protein n=1 Tax=Acer yangbiense TaxID=1000413 RepID=A0A5C7IXK8_9ROSI|nr:hypothetical protein EZV62_001901 [Acer yangbiense]
MMISRDEHEGTLKLSQLEYVQKFDGVDLSGGDHKNSGDGDENVNNGNKEILNDDAETFYNILKDVEQELYPDLLLELFKEALPEGEILPKSFYQTKKIISDLGLGYEKIHACPNDCILYWKEKAQETKCIVCGTSRWKEMADDANQSSLSDCKVPAKVLCHFP